MSGWKLVQTDDPGLALRDQGWTARLTGGVERGLRIWRGCTDYDAVRACVAGREAHDVANFRANLGRIEIRARDGPYLYVVERDASIELQRIAIELERAWAFGAALGRPFAASREQRNNENAGAHRKIVRRR